MSATPPAEAQVHPARKGRVRHPFKRFTHKVSAAKAQHASNDDENGHRSDSEVHIRNQVKSALDGDTVSLPGDEALVALETEASSEGVSKDGMGGVAMGDTERGHIAETLRFSNKSEGEDSKEKEPLDDKLPEHNTEKEGPENALAKAMPVVFVEENLPAMPPDEVLDSMDTIVDSRLSGLSPEDFFDICWSESNTPFYAPWLVERGNVEVDVGAWAYADGGEPFTDAFCKEKYDQKRVVVFKFKRTDHLATSSALGTAKQTQYCRIEGEDRLVLATTVETEGTPYSGTGTVQIRWVAARSGKDLRVKVGILPLVASQFRDLAKAETTATQLDLYIHVKTVCAAFAARKASLFRCFGLFDICCGKAEPKSHNDVFAET